MADLCTVGVGVTGGDPCPIIFKSIDQIGVAPRSESFEAATEELLIAMLRDPAEWVSRMNAAAASRTSMIQGIEGSSPTTPDNKTQEMPYGKVINVKEIGATQLFTLDPEVHTVNSANELRKFNSGTKKAVYEFSKNGNLIKGKLINDGTNFVFSPFNCNLTVLQNNQADGDTTVETTRITYQYDNVSDYADNGRVIELGFDIVDILEGLTPVKIASVVSASVTEIVVQTYGKLQDLTGSDDWFVLNGTTPVVVVPTESLTIPGQYTLTGTGFTTGYTVGFNLQPVATTDGYEGTNSVAITVA